MNLVLIGYYGFGNLGDEAILKTMVAEIKKYNPSVKLSVIAKHPEITSAKYQVAALGRFQVLKIINTLRQSDALVFGGGGVLQDVTSFRSLFYYLAVIFLAKLFRKKIALLGNGFGPIKRFLSKPLIKLALNHICLITTREERSALEIKSLGISSSPLYVTADLALLITPAGDIRLQEICAKEKLSQNGSKLIGVSLRKPVGLSRKQEAQFIAKMGQLCQDLSQRLNAKIVFLPLHHPQDIKITLKVSEKMQHTPCFITGDYTPEEIAAVIKKLDLMIGMRLHALVFACLAATPCLGLSYDPKVSAFLKIIEAPGINILEFESSQVIETVENLLSKRSEISDSLAQKYQFLKEKSSQNFRLLFQHLGIIRQIQILGINIDNISFEEALQQAQVFIESKLPHLIVTPNPEIIMLAQNDPALQKIINFADLKIPDGIGLLLAGRIINQRFKDRVSGIDLMNGILDLANRKRYKLYLLGSQAEVVETAVSNIKSIYSNLKIAGFHHGYLDKNTETKVIEEIHSLQPDILLVGMGQGKQEKWASANLPRLNVPLTLTVGGSFDVWSGRVKRAPLAFRKLGLEWFYRLIKEPQRAGRMSKLPQFTLKVFFNHIFKK